jgi:hypothetical protein
VIQLSREDFVELGLSIPTRPLIGWVTGQLAAVQGREKRLEGRGVTASFLTEVKTLVGAVARLQIALEDSEESLPPEVARAQRIREEAFTYWQEAQQILKVEFGAFPEIQVQGRLGVRTGRLLATLCREMECAVAMLRLHSTQLSWLAANDAFLRSGDGLIGELKEAKAGLDSARRLLSPVLLEQCCEKGKLYDLTRKLVRIGRLAFLHEPEQAAAFNYTLLREELRAHPAVRTRTPKAIAR